MSWGRPDQCARPGCCNPPSWFYSGPVRDQPDEWVCDSCYKAEEFVPGHVLTGGDVHIRGICNDCDARCYVTALSLEQVESLYRQGVFGQDLYEAYTHVWATSAFRYSAVSRSWAESPVIPEVVRLVAIMRGALALRTAEKVKR